MPLARFLSHAEIFKEILQTERMALKVLLEKARERLHQLYNAILVVEIQAKSDNLVVTLNLGEITEC